MKKLLKQLSIALSAIIFFQSQQAGAQSPEKMSYQAIIRNNSSQLVTNHAVTIKISILAKSISGSAVYTETHSATTNDNGLVNIVIGTGTAVFGDFSNIDWANGPYFIKTETDPSGGTNYTITGTSQLLSVPYALYAEKSGGDFSGKYDDLTGKPSIPDTLKKIKLDAGNNAIINVSNPANSQDAATKNYVDATKSLIQQAIPDTLKKLKLDAGNNTINNVSNPVNAQDAATKDYVDATKSLIHQLEDMLIDNSEFFVTDITGNHYKTVRIGTQVWMAENLKTTKFNDGTAIAYPGTDNTAWLHDTTGGYSWYNNDQNNSGYGALYNWYTVSTNNLCPTGWHVPTNDEWTTLINYLGGATLAGGKLKETGTTHWTSNSGATNDTKFTALPGGQRTTTATPFSNLNTNGYWWCSTEFNTTNANYFNMVNTSAIINNSNSSKSYGFSIRCVKN